MESQRQIDDQRLVRRGRFIFHHTQVGENQAAYTGHQEELLKEEDLLILYNVGTIVVLRVTGKYQEVTQLASVYFKH